MVTRCTSLLLHSQRSTPLRGGAFAWCSHFVSHFAPNVPTESCRCTNRIPWYHQNPAYTHRILFALTAWVSPSNFSLIQSVVSLQWRHNGHNGVSNHQLCDCLLSRLIRRRSKKTSKLHVTGLCAGNSPVTGEFPAQMASNTEYVSIWWHHHVSAKACKLVCQSEAGKPSKFSSVTKPLSESWFCGQI